jgi:hypothetical protein
MDRLRASSQACPSPTHSDRGPQQRAAAARIRQMEEELHKRDGELQGAEARLQRMQEVLAGREAEVAHLTALAEAGVVSERRGEGRQSKG